MEIPNAFKGHYYPSSRIARCPRFHRCIVTNKCQSFDRHLLECNLCESRTTSHETDPDAVPLGGHLAEGEFYPDLQDAIRQLELRMNIPFIDRNAEVEVHNSVDIVEEYRREKRITDMIQKFTTVGPLKMDEAIVNTYVDPETAKLLGRLE